MNSARLVTALFKNKISPEEIPFFRGSIIQKSGNDPLFHNHNSEGYNYKYPLVQYKRINGQAAVIGINQGADAIERLFGDGILFTCQLGNRKTQMDLSSIRSEKVWVKCDESLYTYSVYGWLPLNSENYREYQRTEGLADRVKMLERILVANILSFAKGIGIYFDKPVICRLLQLIPSDFKKYKQVELMSFKASFQCNVSLPEYIGIGKSVSVNNGVITQIK